MNKELHIDIEDNNREMILLLHTWSEIIPYI